MANSNNDITCFTLKVDEAQLIHDYHYLTPAEKDAIRQMVNDRVRLRVAQARKGRPPSSMAGVRADSLQREGA